MPRSHGMSGTPEHRTWKKMRERCHNPNHKYYHNYGGRGVTICEAWDDFTTFFADMGERPSAKHSIDRIENDKGYCRNNCKWSTRKEQSNNRRSNRYLTYKGETLNITQWTQKLGLKRATLFTRMYLGWSVDEAIETPVGGRRG